MTQKLFLPLRLGSLDLQHRVVMAPLTRMRAAQSDQAPKALIVAYYRQCASQGGLIITEGSQISHTGQGMPATPGIHSQMQIEGWKAVTHASRATFYGGGAEGYVDYPALDASMSESNQ